MGSEGGNAMSSYFRATVQDRPCIALFLIESSVHSDKFHIASTPVSLHPQASRINPAPVSSDMASFFQRAQAPARDLSPPTDEIGHACHPSLDLEALARWQQVISVGVHARNNAKNHT